MRGFRQSKSATEVTHLLAAGADKLEPAKVNLTCPNITAENNNGKITDSVAPAHHGTRSGHVISRCGRVAPRGLHTGRSAVRLATAVGHPAGQSAQVSLLPLRGAVHPRKLRKSH